MKVVETVELKSFICRCFTCSTCSNVIGDSESYALIERSQLYCGLCYKMQIPTSSSVQQFNSEKVEQILKRPPHSIRLVEIQWKKENKNSIRLSRIEDESTGGPSAGIRISE